MSASLAEDFAIVLADLPRMAFDNADPMRYAKRQAKEAALRILQGPMACAQQVARLPEPINGDFKEAVKPTLPAAKDPCLQCIAGAVCKTPSCAGAWCGEARRTRSPCRVD